MIAAISELQAELSSKRPALEALLSAGKLSDLHFELNYIAETIGRRHSIEMRINFPQRESMGEVIAGKRNISIVFHPLRKGFAIDAASIKEKSASFFPGCRIIGFEAGEGFHITFNGGKVSVFPGSVHLWCEVSKAEKFLDWIIPNVYR